MAASTGAEFPTAGPGIAEPPPGRRPRHETGALLRAHLAAAAGLRHLTRHCAVCARLLRLAMEPVTGADAPGAATGPGTAAGAPSRAVEAVRDPRGTVEPSGTSGRTPGGRSPSPWTRDESPPAT
ncbi:DUF6274 family protein [Streptomyces sp. NPDC057682]|uniref:DUF6274 family protein n=1 Tax=Streptomyces sp. NPDC057682 TaxID=3346210 RepID=UPI0036A225C4